MGQVVVRAKAPVPHPLEKKAVDHDQPHIVQQNQAVSPQNRIALLVQGSLPMLQMHLAANPTLQPAHIDLHQLTATNQAHRVQSPVDQEVQKIEPPGLVVVLEGQDLVLAVQGPDLVVQSPDRQVLNRAHTVRNPGLKVQNLGLRALNQYQVNMMLRVARNLRV